MEEKKLKKNEKDFENGRKRDEEERKKKIYLSRWRVSQKKIAKILIFKYSCFSEK